MKTIFFNLIFIICLVNHKVSAQPTPHYNSFGEKIILESEFIFEGVVVEGSDFIDPTNTTSLNLFNSYIVKVTKILRGKNLTLGGTIEVIEGVAGAKVDSIFGTLIIPPFDKNHAIDAPWLGGKGIYFGKQTPTSINNPNVYIRKGDDYKLSKGMVKTFDNTITVIVNAATDLNLKKYFEQGSSKVTFIGIRAFGKDFKTKEEFYQFLSKYPNITIPKDTTNEK